MGDSSAFFANKSCRYYPCHEGTGEINCLFCYCPLYSRKDCPGTYQMIKTRDGKWIKSCMNCTFPHRKENYGAVIRALTGRDEPAVPEAPLTQEEAALEKKISARWDAIAKPIDSLGKLEKLITKIGVVQETEKVHLDRRALLILAGDHGVVKEGVTQTDSSVTKIVAGNLAAGKGVTSILAEKCGADVFVIDAGMAGGPYPEKQLVTGQVVDRKVRRGSGDIAVEDAMSPGQCRQALHAGEDLVRELAEKGYDIAAVGEMGIGNTTPSAVLIGHFLHKNAETVTGRGAGLSDEGLAKKTRVVAQALERLAGVTDPVQALAAGGGLEIAMMAGVYLGGAKYRMPVIMDGVISQAAALTAVMIDPQVRKILIPSHRSGESCGTYVLAALDLSPVIDGDMSLGEGSGAVMLLPLLDAALAVYTRMSSFADCRIKPYKRFGETS